MTGAPDAFFCGASACVTCGLDNCLLQSTMMVEPCRGRLALKSDEGAAARFHTASTLGYDNPLEIIQSASASSAAPVAITVCSPNGASFSAMTHTVSATMTARFITPPTNRISISAQQQPRQ